MQRQHLSQRALSLLLALVMILTCAPTAFAEESTEASMMRLMKTEGTVSVTNGKGRSVKTRDEMRLNSGYGLKTSEASYAWINLDDAKLVKMDAVTEIGIRKSGKKLDILVDSGNLFFNVSKPLEDDELLNIRTSTMAIGVRGTCGWVRAVDQWTSQLYVLEGNVEVTVTDPVTGESKTDTVESGETVTCKVYPQDKTGSKCDIIRQEFTANDIDGFVLVELVKDSPLCDKIYEASGIDVRNSGIDPAKKLKEDQESVHEKLEQINGQLANQENNISKDPVWTDPAPDGITPPESTSGSSNTGTPSAPTETVTLNMPQTAAAVNEALNRSNVRQVVLQPGTRSRASTTSLLEVDSTLTVPSGKILTLNSGVSLTANEGRLLAVQGTLTVGGDFRLAGDLAAGSNGVVKALAFKLAASVANWRVSYTTDSAGYYTLTYSPKSVYTITFNPNGGTVTPNKSVTGADGRLTAFAGAPADAARFGGSFYKIYGITLSWDEAKAYCEQLGGHLASITSAEEQDFISSLNANAIRLWIGGYRDDNFNWFWVTGEPWGYTNWAEGEPSNSGAVGPEESCLAIWPGQWNDLNTNNKSEQNGFVCEWEAGSGLPTPTRPGYTFDGWFTSAGTPITIATVFTQDTMVYAHWTAESTSGVDWKYDSNIRTLYIFGSGPMQDYGATTDANGSLVTGAPWDKYRSEVWAVSIRHGITSIAAYAFPECPNLLAVDIPSSVTRVDNFAFSGSNSLADVYYGGMQTQWNAVSISSGNEPLHSANIHWQGDGTGTVCVTFDPNGGTVTPKYYFVGQDGKIGALPTPTRSGYTFDGWFTSATGGTQVTASTVFPADATIYAHWTATSTSGVTWQYDQATKVLYITGSGPMEDYDFATGTGFSSAPWAAHATEMQSLVIENGVTRIGSYAFYSCRGLTSVTIPASVTSIGDSAFFACRGLTNVTIPDGVTFIDKHAFEICLGLTSVTIPVSVTSIEKNAFYLCNALNNVYYTGTEAQWNAISIGSSNDPLKTATLHCNSARSAVSYSAPGYTDVPATASYAEAVRYCKDNGLMDGTSATTFSPDGTLTRAMMVTVLHRLAGKPFAYATDSFTDVPAGKWYSEAISWASGQGIVNGYNPTTFGTNDPVTHEQVGLILQRYSGDQSIQVAGSDSPKSPATRAEVAMTLMNYMKNRRPGTLSEASAIDVMCAPSGIALDKDGNFFVTDIYGKQIWQVQNRSGTAYAGGATVVDLYGQPMGGYNDASLQNSYFRQPWAIAPFLDGWAVSDTANNVVRLVSGSSVQTLNGATHEKLKVTDLGVAFDGPTGLASDDYGNLYVSDTLNGAVRRVKPDGGVMTVAQGLSDPTGLCWKDGALYIAETGRNRVLKLTNGKTSTLAGSGLEGMADGIASEASFNAPRGVAVGDDGSVYVADTGNGAIRVIKGGAVITLVSRDPEQLDGGLMSPVGLLAQGRSLYICDTFARKIFVYQLG